MAAWFTVYCRQSLAHVTRDDMAAHLRGPKLDWDILAETFGIEDDALVKQGIAALRIKPATGKLGESFEIRYRPAKSRPLIVYRWTEDARVQEELTEAEENHLENCRGRGVTQVRSALPGR